MILKIKDFLSGKKAYLVGILMMVTGFYSDNMELILQGLGVITLRAGISKK